MMTVPNNVNNEWDKWKTVNSTYLDAYSSYQANFVTVITPGSLRELVIIRLVRLIILCLASCRNQGLGCEIDDVCYAALKVLENCRTLMIRTEFLPNVAFISIKLSPCLPPVAARKLIKHCVVVACIITRNVPNLIKQWAGTQNQIPESGNTPYEQFWDGRKSCIVLDPNERHCAPYSWAWTWRERARVSTFPVLVLQSNAQWQRSTHPCWMPAMHRRWGWSPHWRSCSKWGMKHTRRGIIIINQTHI